MQDGIIPWHREDRPGIHHLSLGSIWHSIESISSYYSLHKHWLQQIIGLDNNALSNVIGKFSNYISWCHYLYRMSELISCKGYSNHRAFHFQADTLTDTFIDFVEQKMAKEEHDTKFFITTPWTPLNSYYVHFWNICKTIALMHDALIQGEFPRWGLLLQWLHGPDVCNSSRCAMGIQVSNYIKYNLTKLECSTLRFPKNIVCTIYNSKATMPQE